MRGKIFWRGYAAIKISPRGGKKRSKQKISRNFCKRGRERATFCGWEAVVRRDRVAKGATPGREQIIRRMWKLANAGVEDAVKLACFPTEEWGGLEGMNLDALTEFKRGSNGVVELKFTDRARLLERLLDAADHSGEDQVDRFLSAMEHQEEGK